MNATPQPWDLALHAAAALAVDPVGLHGVCLRDRAGPVRDKFLAVLTDLIGRPVRRLPASLDARALSPSLDLGETLRTGREVRTAGLLEEAAGAVLILPMAERLDGGTASALAAAADTGTGPLVLLDEGAEPDETAPSALTERLAISVSLEGVAWSEITEPVHADDDIRKARMLLAQGISDGDALAGLTQLAGALGIASMRAPLLALRLARALAALDGAKAIGEMHLSLATLMCLAPRATILPQTDAEEDPTPPPPPEDEPQEPKDQKSGEQGPLEDRVLEAVAAAMLDLNLTGARQRGGTTASGAGNRKRSDSHGRPLRPRPGKPEGKRLDVFSTLLNAAAWQPLRRRAAPDRAGFIVVPDDFRIKQYDRPGESVLIFLVDASGSQAAARMAEAKGAVEMMLAEAYRRREKVALIAFRGQSADLILPPTRSLLQAKRRLAVLPGGGPTPLATALVAGRELALQLRRRGTTPYLITLTDGRGNVALSGEHGRAEAKVDQALAARAIAADRFTAAVVDTANRPQADARALADQMEAAYLPLPRADAHGISRVVRANLAA